MHKLSAREYSFEQNSCLDEGGEGNLFVKNSMIPILRHLAKDVEIKTNWEVILFPLCFLFLKLIHC